MPDEHNQRPQTEKVSLDDIQALLGDDSSIERFPPPIFDEPVVKMADLREIGLPLNETTYLALGGGIGSFAWVDTLMIHGASPAAIGIIGIDACPYGRYQELCRRSQIPDHERLRSDSGSTPDNIWGFPGYAMRELVDHLRAGQWAGAAKIGWQIFSEPVFSESFTPIAGRVYASLDREAARIGWDQMWRFGRIRAIRKTDDGRYVVAYSQTQDESQHIHKLIVAPYVHLAVGYPGIQLLPDLIAYRERTHDFQAVVNAYEPHDHLYNMLAEKGGTVVLRGRGIVASRILQRLHEAHQLNPNIKVIHLMRSPVTTHQRFGRARRKFHDHRETQPYNFPKSAFGGRLRDMLAQADDARRQELLAIWGGTTTADRKDWRQIAEDGLRDGWYIIRFGDVLRVDRNPNGKLITRFSDTEAGGEVDLNADFIMDATGLNAKLEMHPLLKDLLDCYDLTRNGRGYLRVNDYFEVEDMRNGDGRFYAAGVMTGGGQFAPVDSFVGLQYAAQNAMQGLIAAGAPDIQPLTPLRSISQWLRWARGVQP